MPFSAKHLHRSLLYVFMLKLIIVNCVFAIVDDFIAPFLNVPLSVLPL